MKREDEKGGIHIVDGLVVGKQFTDIWQKKESPQIGNKIGKLSIT